MILSQTQPVFCQPDFSQGFGNYQCCICSFWPAQPISSNTSNMFLNTPHRRRNTQTRLDHRPASAPRTTLKAQTARHSAQAGDTTKPKAAPVSLCPPGLPQGTGRCPQIPPKWHHPRFNIVQQTSAKKSQVVLLRFPATSMKSTSSWLKLSILLP